MHNLLNEELIRVRLSDGRVESRSLPGILAALASGEAESFPALMPHQRHAWFAFLVQLAAIALHKCKQTEPPANAHLWEEWLRDLAGGDDAWSLIVDDLSKPAFMQPPVIARSWNSIGKEWTAYTSPEWIDLHHVNLDRNHEIKKVRFQAKKPDHWVFAITALQTMAGPVVAGKSKRKPGTRRISRPCIELINDMSWSRRFNLDVHRLIDLREESVNLSGTDGNIALLWIVPWDGTCQLSISQLDPYFIEVCRMVRLKKLNKEIVAYESGVNRERIFSVKIRSGSSSKEKKQPVFGDPWTPRDIEKDNPLSISNFSYKEIEKLMFSPRIGRNICFHWDESSTGKIFLQLFAVARSKGKTEGLHERRLLIPPDIHKKFRMGETDKIAQLSEWQIEDAGALTKIINRTLLILLQDPPEEQELNWKDERPGRWLEEFDRRIDQIFFDRLWDGVRNDEPEEARLKWQKEIVEIARELLERASHSLPVPSGRRYRALTHAEGVLEGGWRKALTNLADRERAAREESARETAL